jgi:hypothetical protein
MKAYYLIMAIAASLAALAMATQLQPPGSEEQPVEVDTDMETWFI